MEVVNKPPIDLATTKRGGAERRSVRALTFTVYAAGTDERDAAKRPLGHVTVRPGLVAPGQIAAVRTACGLLRLKKIYYFRGEGGREHVRLESLELGRPALLIPLGEVTVEGTVICVCGIDEECGCA